MNKTIQIYFLSILVVCISFLSSCTIAPSEFENAACITPLEKLAIPFDIFQTELAEYPEIGPLGAWEFQTSIPEPSLRGIPPQFVIGSNGVWILPMFGTKVFHYDLTTEDWKEYTTINNYSAVPRNLYKAQDGTIWGLGTIIKDFDSQIDYSFLSMYNNDSDQFEFVKDVDDLLDDVMVISSPADITEDQTGKLWFFGSLLNDDDVGLLSFDPSNRKAETHFSLPTGLIYSGPVASQNGTIWFYRGGSERELMKFSTKAEQIQTYIGSPNFDQIGHIGTLFFDQDGKLWLDNQGWLDFTIDPINPIWYEIIPNPVFLTNRAEWQSDGGPKYGWVWMTPSNIYQSSNGWYWFRTNYGTIKLDPNSEEWCMFTTGNSPVEEDDEGNVWIVVFDKLYKHKLDY